MASDWIKMRVNLVTHPKVMAIAEFLADQSDFQQWSTLSSFVPCYGGSDDQHRNDRNAALRVTRYVTVCALLRFWGYANEHSREEFVSFMTIEGVDEIVQVPSFGRALQSVGWIEISKTPAGICLPNFSEFNAVADERQSGSKAAERQRRYRERQKASQSDGFCDVTRDDSSDATGDVTVTSRNAPREEKRREEKKDLTPSVPSEKISLGEDGKWAGIPEKLSSSWSEAYPAVNVPAELAKAAAWIIANPKNRKSNYARFLTNWLGRAQDNAKPVRNANGHGGALNGNDARYVN